MRRIAEEGDKVRITWNGAPVHTGAKQGIPWKGVTGVVGRTGAIHKLTAPNGESLEYPDDTVYFSEGEYEIITDEVVESDFVKNTTKFLDRLPLHSIVLVKYKMKYGVKPESVLKFAIPAQRIGGVWFIVGENRGYLSAELPRMEGVYSISLVDTEL